MREFDDLQVRQLLEFVTSSDRVPVNGVGSINFTIQKNGDEDLVSTFCSSLPPYVLPLILNLLPLSLYVFINKNKTNKKANFF